MLKEMAPSLESDSSCQSSRRKPIHVEAGLPSAQASSSPGVKSEGVKEGFQGGFPADRLAFDNLTNVVQVTPHLESPCNPSPHHMRTPSLQRAVTSDCWPGFDKGGVGQELEGGGFLLGSPHRSTKDGFGPPRGLKSAVSWGPKRALFREDSRADFLGALREDSPSQSALYGEVSPADRARIARTVSGFHCEPPVVPLPVSTPTKDRKRELLRTMRSIQLSGFLVNEAKEEGGFLDAGEVKQHLDTPAKVEVPLQAGGLPRCQDPAPGGSLPAAQNGNPLSVGLESEAGSIPEATCTVTPPLLSQLSTGRFKNLPQVTVVPITASFDSPPSSYTDSPSLQNPSPSSYADSLPLPKPSPLRRILSEIPEDPASCPSSPMSARHLASKQPSTSRRHSFSDTPRPPLNKLRRSFSEAPTFARELLRATSLSACLSACQEPHEGPCFSSQMIDALVLSRAVYETKLADMLFYMELSRAELPCGLFELLTHANMEKVRDGKVVRRRLSAQPYAIVRSSHGHFLVGCRGTDCIPDMVQDLQIIHKRFLGLGAAHWGFVQRAHSIDIQPMLDLLAAGEHIVLTGHSMGGAVAALLTLRLMDATQGEVRSQLQCITFGCPLFANGDLADHINTEYKDLFVHILAKHDAVPRMVPLLAGLFNLAMGSTRGDHPLDAVAIVNLAARVLRPSPLGPIALGAKALVNGVGNLVPRRFRGLLKGLIRVAFPPFSAIYAAAGHMVVLDRDSKAFLPFSSELKSIKCQLGFALGMTNPGLLREHEISYYVTHVGQSTQPWLEKFGCVSAGVGTPNLSRMNSVGASVGFGSAAGGVGISPLKRMGSVGASVGIGSKAAGVGISPLNRMGSIGGSVGIGSAAAGVGKGSLNRMGSIGGSVGMGSAGAHSPGVGFGMGLRTGSRIPGCELGLDVECRLQRQKLKPTTSSLCLDRLFDSEEELDGMLHTVSDFDALPVMTPSPRVRVVTPATRRKMRLRATCTVSFKCRGLVGLPAEEPDSGAKPRKKRGIMRCFGFLRHVGRITRVAKSVEDVCLAYTSLRIVTLVVTHFM